MRKLVATILLGVPCLMGVLLYWGGHRAEEEYERLVASLAGSRRLIATPLRYERGWIQSRAQMRIDLRRSGDPDAASFGFDLDHAIAHGPLALAELMRGRIPTEWVLAVVRTEFRPDLADHPEFAAALGDDPVFTVRTTLYPEGYAEAEFSSAAIQKDKDWGAVGVYWQGATGTVVFTRGIEHASGALRSSGLDLITNAIRIRLRGLGLDLDFEHDAVGLPLGEAQLSAASLQLADPEDPQDAVTLRDLRYAQSVDSDGDLFRLRFSLTVADLERGEDAYGPLELDLVARNLDGRSVVAYRKRRLEITTGDAPEPERQLALLAAGADLLPRILSRGPELELARLRLHGETGDFEAAGRLGVRADPNPPSGTTSPFGLGAVEATAELRMPMLMLDRIAGTVIARGFEIADFEPSAEAASDMDEAELASAQASAQEAMALAIDVARRDFIEGLIARNVVWVDGDSYRVDASYALGELLLNGKPFDPATLLGGEQTIASTLGTAPATP
ncbi:MAG: YdgA family protein [Deltaproteobacteria bacterium]|nr:MAG: YdgA family protein [Deltaproteobacteria bacterium]